jgi:hypothetical protein
VERGRYAEEVVFLRFVIRRIGEAHVAEHSAVIGKKVFRYDYEERRSIEESPSGATDWI